MPLPFGIGTTEEVFHSFGTSPSLIDLLNSIVSPLAILVAVALSMVAEISSGPLALVVSSESSSCLSCSVHKSSGGHAEGVL